VEFNFRDKEKATGAKSGDQGGWGTRFFSCFAENSRVSRCVVVVQHPGLVPPTFRPLPSHCLPQTLHDLQVKLAIDCLTTWNKLIINDALKK
jgi:hypothetical protein